MKKAFKLIALMAVVIGLIVAAGCGAKKEAAGPTPKQPEAVQPAQPAQPAEQPVLKIGTEAAYAPFEYVENEKITGFDAEFVTAIAEAMGMKPELTHVEWDGLYPALNTGQIDIVISAMTITDERKKEVNFSDPYFEAQQIIAIKEGAAIKGLKDLIGKPVGVQANTTGQYVLEKVEGLKKEDIKPYPTTPDAMMNLVNGSVQAVVADSPVVLNFIKTNADAKLTTVDDNFEKEYYGMAIKKDNTELVTKVNEAIKTIKANGKYDEIYNKYFGK